MHIQWYIWGGGACWCWISLNKHDWTTSVTALLYQLNLKSPKNAGGSIDWLFCTKFWTNIWRFRWIMWTWFCVVDLWEDLLPNRTQGTSLCLNSVSKVFCSKNYYWVEFITRLQHLVGLSIIIIIIIMEKTEAGPKRPLYPRNRCQITTTNTCYTSICISQLFAISCR